MLVESDTEIGMTAVPLRTRHTSTEISSSLTAYDCSSNETVTSAERVGRKGKWKGRKIVYEEIALCQLL